MKYLDERISVTTSTSITTNGLYTYYIYSVTDTQPIFVGSVYIDSGSVTIDITDIARNYFASWSIDSSTPINNIGLYVKIVDNTTEYTSDVVYITPIYRYPNGKNTLETELDNNNSTLPLVHQELLPVYPNTPTEKINFDLYLHNGSETDSDYGVYPIPNKTISLQSNTYDRYLNTWGSMYTQSQSWVNPTPTDKLTSINNSIVWEETVSAKPETLDLCGSIIDLSTVSYPYTYINSSSTSNDSSLTLIDNTTINRSIESSTYPVGSITITPVYSSIDGSANPIDNWTYVAETNTYINNTEVTDSVLLSLRYTDANGDYIVEQDTTWNTHTTYSWDFCAAEYSTDVDEVMLHLTNYLDVELPVSYARMGSTNIHATLSYDTTNKLLILKFQTTEYNTKISYTFDEIASTYPDTIYIANTKYPEGYVTPALSIGEPEVESGDIEVFASRYIQSTSQVLLYTIYQIDKNNNIHEVTNSISMPALDSTTNKLKLLIKYLDTDGVWREGIATYYSPTIPYTYWSGIDITLTKTITSSGYLRIQVGGGNIFGSAPTTTNTQYKVAQTSCSKYFLIWRDRYLSQQIQPFNKINTYSEEITGSEITNYYGARNLYKTSNQPKWKLNSDWITESQYKYYESIFVSPTVQLYDAENDKLYDVIITDRSYTEKTFNNQGKQLFNLTIEVESITTQDILY